MAQSDSFFTGCWQRLRPILEPAVGPPGNERPACLEQAFVDDGALRARIADRSMSPKALL